MIKNEFNYRPPRGNDVFINQNSRGLGVVYNYINGYNRLRGNYDSNTSTFTSYSDPHRVHIDFIKQDPFDYTRLIADKTDEFTSAGVRRIDDSIRSYVYCILGAQVQTRANILGEDGPQLDAQKQFLVLIDDCIKIGNNLQKSIANYQDACTKATSTINYVVGTSLYMTPSNMNLDKVSERKLNYSDMIVIAKDDMPLGVALVTKTSQVKASKTTPKHPKKRCPYQPISCMNPVKLG